MLPDHLNSNSAMGLVAGAPIAQFEIGGYRNFVYLVIDWDSRKAALVDPQRDLAPPLSALRENDLELEAILLTHTHHDHIAGVPELVKRFPTVPVMVHPDDAHRL